MLARELESPIVQDMCGSFGVPFFGGFLKEICQGFSKGTRRLVL